MDVVVFTGRGISNEDRGIRVVWTGVLYGVGCEREGVTGIGGRGGRFNIREVVESVDTGESVLRKVLLVDSGGADGEGDWESWLRVIVNKMSIRIYERVCFNF